MPTPRKPQPSPRNSSRQMLLLCVAALVLIGGWVWVDYATTPRPATPAAVGMDTIRVAVADTVREISRPVPVVVSSAAPATKPAPIRKPVITEPEPIRETTPKPAVDQPVLKPSPVVEKPKPIKCDQLVMRNGDLLDVTISEIGVQAIKYKRCNWTDSPNYVVLKADVLSIHFANGDTERF